MALRTGYGTAFYGPSKYGLPEVYEGQVSDNSAASASALAERIALGATAVETALSHVVAGVRVQNGLMDDASSVSVVAAGFISIAGVVSDTSNVSVALYWNRVRPFAAQDSVTIEPTVTARLKWTDIDPPTTIWTDIALPTTTWVAADYREGAA